MSPESISPSLSAHARPRARGRQAPIEGLPIYGAVDLGSNNCRLLMAQAEAGGLRVVDSFSRITRLGAHLGERGRFDPAAIDRTIAALTICAEKLARGGVTAYRAVATEACRRAADFQAFRDRVGAETGLSLDLITAEEEAAYALAGCAPLLADGPAEALLIDIGGGSTELAHIDVDAGGVHLRTVASLPLGVVALADRYPGDHGEPEMFARIVDAAATAIRAVPFAGDLIAARAAGRLGFLGASGTVTTLAGVHLGLGRYDRSRVDGTWLSAADADRLTRELCALSVPERGAIGCVGPQRADLVVAGCAILAALIQVFDIDRLRVADRGVREGLLLGMMTEDAR